MPDTVPFVDLAATPQDLSGHGYCAHAALRRMIEHAAHRLPTQGPITVFVHHNTLHAFEDLPFEQALAEGHRVYSAQPYLSEQRYCQELARGRIRPEDLSAVLLEDLDGEADRLLGFFGTRYHLRMAMLEHPLPLGTDAEVEWYVAETDALRRLRSATPAPVRRRMIEQTRAWVFRELEKTGAADSGRHTAMIRELVGDRGSIDGWDDVAWEAIVLQLLWRLCRDNVQATAATADHPRQPLVRHRDLLREATGDDTDQHVHGLLTTYTSAFLDQGLARWPMPDRGRGYFDCFLRLYRCSASAEHWRRGLAAELNRLQQTKTLPLESIAESLDILGVAESEREEFIAQTLGALRGWAGMVWQMETNASWTVRPAPPGSLVEYLAVRLIVERITLTNVAADTLSYRGELRGLRAELRRRLPPHPAVNPLQRAFLVFQLAQVRGWLPEQLAGMAPLEWSRLVQEMEAFSGVERRRLYQAAYERRYQTQALDALAVHARRAAQATAEPPLFQLVCCIDDREESFRRHLEEVSPQCETFGVAGFFALAMYYRGAADAHFRPLCPAVIRPRHYVVEEVAYSFESSHRRRAETRRAIGSVSHHLHLGSRSLLGGLIASLLGSLAAVPMVTRILLPRLTAQLKRLAGSFVQPPPSTQLQIERTTTDPGPDDGHVGYTVDEMAEIVARVLQDMGVVGRLSRLVIVVGHGSSSLNNPHESAYSCGACSGARGGPNARGFAQMANDHRVRALLRQRGTSVPDTTFFVGAFHNTCDDDVSYFDLDRLPVSHRRDFEAARDAIERARGRNAHERCRRFESADLTLTPQEALRHVEARAEDLSQARPEYNHATNALHIVGRRALTRGLYLDRRAFLTSYDPSQDTSEHSVLARILAAAIPVCAGINLEYYFSTVDVNGYGCGSKLPHNIAALLGVMEGAASDLRTGLSAQMVEIHEPLRILTVIETTPQVVLKIMDQNPSIGRLIANAWVQLALIDPVSRQLSRFHRGRFESYAPQIDELPQVSTSVQWYGGYRHHLGFAEILASSRSGPQAGSGADL